MKTRRAIIWTILVSAALSNPAALGDEPATEATPAEASSIEDTAATPVSVEETENALRIDLTMYTWLSSLSSEVTARDREVTSEMNLGDILDALDFANFAHLELQKGKWGAFTEIDFIKLSNDTDFRNPRGRFPFKINADGVIKQTMLELGGIRTFQGERVGVDALFGARYFRLESDVNVGPLESHISKDWVDPMVGARLRLRINEQWSASLRGDLAGFGAGSELTTNIIGAVSYSFSERYAIGFGYRYLDIDYEKDRIELSTTTYGPVVGLTISF